MADHGDHGGDHGHYGGKDHAGGTHGGGLLSGLPDSGHTYGAHISHATPHAGHHHVAGFGNIDLADALTTAMAIDLVMGHDHSLGHGHHGHSGTGPHATHHIDKSKSDQGRLLEIPGMVQDSCSVTLLKWPHRRCEPMKHIQEHARRLKLIRAGETNSFDPRRMDGNKEIDKKLFYIASKEPFARPESKLNPPNGWWKNSTGETHMWRQFWQWQPSMAPIFGRPKFETWRTYLVISGATWWYRESKDCETRITFSVWSKGLVKDGLWTFDFETIRKHLGFCEQMSESAETYLGRHIASRESVAFRKALTPEQLAVPTESKLREPAAVVSSIMPVSSTFLGGDAVQKTDGSFDPRV